MANWQVISLDTTTPQLRAPGTGDGYSFNSGSTQLGVWTTTGLGIGTASPTDTLGYGRALDIQSNAGAAVYLRDSDNTSEYTALGYEGGTAKNFSIYNTAAGDVRIYTSGSQRLTVNSSGNVGIGTTSPATKLHVAAGNVTVDNAWGYLAADNAGTRESLLSITSANNVNVSAPTLSGSLDFNVRNSTGTHRFFMGGSERARIDSSGRLLVGGTSAVYASSNGAIEVQSANSASLNAGRFAANAGGPTLALLKSRNATVGGNTIVVDGDTLGDVSFAGANGTGYDEAARIRASVDGTPGASADMPGRLTFWTSADGSASPTERMRITSAGSVLVGTTDTNPSGNNVVGIAMTASGNIGATRSGGTAANFNRSTSEGAVVSLRYAGAEVGTISVTASATAYNTSSDRRLKSNIVAADDAGAVVDAIQVVKHDWKIGGHVRYGVIAQDLHAVAPEAVKVGDVGEEVSEAWGVDYSKLVPMLVKEIQSLRARVAQLEAK